MVDRVLHGLHQVKNVPSHDRLTFDVDKMRRIMRGFRCRMSATPSAYPRCKRHDQ